MDAAGDLLPDRLSQTGRRELRHMLRAYNLELSALGCPLRRGLDTAENQEGRIDHIRKVLGLSFDLGPRRVLVRAGPIPEDPRDVVPACSPRGGLGPGENSWIRIRATLALETGTDVRRFWRLFSEVGLIRAAGVSYDPAACCYADTIPVKRAAARSRMIHVQARDAAVPARRPRWAMATSNWNAAGGLLNDMEYRGR